ncbi:hypothetical protein K443DRAFT_16110 [Laccaria amethystina LaAM-08-1]|uniref:Unplaced genomic scaffold K443scaffold_1187, whole genome shotgun sequence n=1 Tax=Laccaria amethystina LaAM-08-1 TaxID=1095629 RepID=A0A0C9WGH4_9AGAR|nr:hypothetical protein K443DRAFT_16110 [Laccaria amethystina LaAM-08-1]
MQLIKVAVIEDALRSLKLTHAEAQGIVRAFAEAVNCATSPTPSPSVDLPRALSATSYDNLGFGVYSIGDEIDVSDGEGLEDEGSVLAPVPALGSTATSTTAVSPVATAASPIISSVPVVSNAASMAPAVTATTAAASIIATVPSIASVTPVPTATVHPPAVVNPVVGPAPTVVNTAVSPVGAAPLYAALPPNAPSNAVLPPTHLIRVPHGYHVPAANADGPFYVVTRGRNLGIFGGWETVSPLVTGVSHAVYSRVASVAEGHARMNAANVLVFALYLT